MNKATAKRLLDSAEWHARSLTLPVTDVDVSAVKQWMERHLIPALTEEVK